MVLGGLGRTRKLIAVTIIRYFLIYSRVGSSSRHFLLALKFSSLPTVNSTPEISTECGNKLAQLPHLL